MKRKQFNSRLAKAIKKYRLEAELTQQQLAEDCGLTPDWISHFECGRRTPSAFILVQLWEQLSWGYITDFEPRHLLFRDP